MILLYDNPFSPFARKVRMTLQFKEVPYESIDALALAEHTRLHAVNRRTEVPVLVDEDVTVVDSADIVAYLEDRFPTPALLPSSPARRATARRWQRVADTVLDAIIHDVSLWTWPTHHRSDAPPAGVQMLLSRGGIPAVFEPEFVPADKSDLPDSAWILGVALKGEARAYSLNLLNGHEIVNDSLGGRAIAAVW